MTDDIEVPCAAPHVPGYEVLERLGTGGMAETWIARKAGARRPSAIKVLHEHVAENETAVRRFLREAEITSLLDHPNIAALHDAKRVGTQFFIATELVVGVDLEQLLVGYEMAGEKMSGRVFLAVAQGVLAALAYAHRLVGPEGEALGLVHRDVKPSNIMISVEGAVKLIDFGVVRMHLGSFATGPGRLCGTPEYMSPEQVHAWSLDARSDLYSFAAVAYELLTGVPVASGVELREILSAVAVDEVPPIRTHRPDLPEALDAVFARALAKVRDDRYPDAETFYAALEHAFSMAPAKPETIAATLERILPEDCRLARERRALSMLTAPVHDLESTQGALMPPADQATVTMSMVPEASPPATASSWFALALAGLAILAVTGLAGFVLGSSRGPAETVILTTPAPQPRAPAPSAAPVEAPAAPDMPPMPPMPTTAASKAPRRAAAPSQSEPEAKALASMPRAEDLVGRLNRVIQQGLATRAKPSAGVDRAQLEALIGEATREVASPMPDPDRVVHLEERLRAMTP